MTKYILAVIACFFIVTVYGQSSKKALKHSDYDGWKNLKYQKISNNGKWVSYEVNPQKGDGLLYVYQVNTSKVYSFARGYKAKFSFDSNFIIYSIKPQAKVVRKAKYKKTKKKNLPKDSLAILNLTTMKCEKFANLMSLKISEHGGKYIAFLLKEKTIAKDSLANKKSKKLKSANKLKTGKLILKNLLTSNETSFDRVSKYEISRNGNAATFITQSADSLSVASVNYYSFSNSSNNKLFEKKGEARNLAISNMGNKVSYIFSADTCKNKVFDLYYFNNKRDKSQLILDTLSTSLSNKWIVSKNRGIYFSRDGEKLFFGIAAKPIKSIKDTLLDEEKYMLDVWSWKDKHLQPQQKIEAKDDLKKTSLACYNIKSGDIVQLGSESITKIQLFDKNNASLALGSSSLPYQMEESWNSWFRDYYIVDTQTGNSKLILSKKNKNVSISPAQKYIYWYEASDSTWYAKGLKNNKIHNLTASIGFAIYRESHDSPSDPSPYGIVGWTKGDASILIQDRYDIWKIDPLGKKKNVCITRGYGRKNNIRLNYIKFDKEQKYVDLSKTILLSAFGEYNKKSGYYSLLKNNEPKLLVFDDVKYMRIKKAKNANVLIWQRSTFIDYPNLWTSDLNIANQKQISDANPQQKDFNWGDVELVKWTSGDGDKLQGMLFKPENFDPNKKYPMLVYFYERSSDVLHKYYTPQPNWSIINPSYCVSNEYLIFMPDIVYPKVGYPGESAYSAIVTGTLAMMDRYSFIDKDNIALQGQSWGGYQIAYLVTRCNLYKCAMAGAPVTNMTSAYGGIRWKSGCSRMFQYEHTQSRIGGTLWNSTLQYIENSPIFYAPKIETPLLIMHNDHDGAVPWYQGIELFVAMRRLHKPCWMLTYNNESHNLKRRPNRMDLSIRTMQFFDYYLKGKAQPAWMKYGIPATKKGKYDGYELTK